MMKSIASLKSIASIKLLAVFVIATQFAIPSASAQGKSRSPSATGKAKAPREGVFETRIGYTISQESIDLKSGPSTAKMQTQSQGLLGNFGYNSPSRNARLVFVYGLDFGFGTLKGKGNTATIADELKGQMWLLAGANPGLLYRSTNMTSIGLMVPIHYRMIQWKLKSGSALDPDRDTSFSVGVSAVLENRISARSSVHVTLTQHHMWNATMFTFAWKYLL